MDVRNPSNNRTFAERLDERFHISARNSTIANEIQGGTTNFMAGVYIISVSAGMYFLVGENNVLAAMAIAFVTGVISIIMGWFANVPIFLSTGMGLNAFAVFTICLGMGYSYNMVLVCTLIEGVVFLVLSFCGLRSALAKAIPQNMKLLIGAGIGGFLMYIGSQNAHLIVNDDSTLTTMVNFRQDFHTQGITAVLAVFAIALMLILALMDIKANVLIGIFAAWGVGVVCQILKIYVPDPDAGYYSLIPSIGLPHTSLKGAFIGLPSIAGYVAKDWANVVVITCTMFYSDFFDTVGTAITCLNGLKVRLREDLAKMKEEVADSQRIKRLEMEIEGLENETVMKIILIIDAIGTILGAIFRLTTITSFVESMAGKGVTGLSSVVTGCWFLLSIFFASIFTTIPSYATGAALVVVGGSMIYDAMKQLDYSKSKMHQTIPGVLGLVYMILTYNIANGMAWGIIAYSVLSLFVENNRKVEKAGPLMYALSFLLVLRFIYL